MPATQRSTGLGLADVEIIERQPLHRRYLQVDLLRLRHRLHEGGWSAVMDRELVLRGRAVGVLLYDPDRDQVVMVRQFRVGAMGAGDSPWLLELVAGMIDTDETAEQVAARESQEEADMQPEDLQLIYDYYNSPGASDERVILFVGRVNADEAGGVHGLEHEHEDIEVVVLPVVEALAALDSGQISNAMSIIALQWLGAHRQKLQQRWSVTKNSP